MNDAQPTLPNSGGSFVRQADGSLVHETEVTQAAVPPQAPEVDVDTSAPRGKAKPEKE